MPVFLTALALSAGIAAGASTSTKGPAPASPGSVADLLLAPLPPRTSPRLSSGPSRIPEAVTAPCLAGICQPVVDVPGYEVKFLPASRTLLFADLLERSHVEPLASIVSVFAVTGLRLDYTPGFVEGASASGRSRLGSFQLLLRWRLDAWNEPVFRRHAHG